MSWGADFTGLNILSQLAADLHSKTQRLVEQVGLEVADEARRQILEGSPSGRIYSRDGSTWQASAPGEAPASPTGELVESISVDESGLSGLEVDVVAGGPAAFLELGTVNMAARPFLIPAVQVVEERIPDIAGGIFEPN